MDAQEALKKYEKAKTYWSDIYRGFKENVRFSIGLDHWNEDDIKLRGEAGCIVVPILPQFIHQVVNDMRMNTPSINVLPGDRNGDEETAEIIKGLIRNIEYRSNADEAYDTAGEYAVRGGFGFIRVDHDYIGDDSFLQEIILRRVQNPLSVYLDPNSIECDGSDAEYAIVLESISKEDFQRRYPDKQYVSFDTNPNEETAESIFIAEFFVKEYETITKQMGANGEMVDWVDEGEEKEKTKTKRKLKKTVIRRYKFSGSETLEEAVFPGEYIPIVMSAGEEVWEDGKRHLLSLISLAKDAQRRVNKWAAKESEILDMAPIAPVQAPVGAVDDFMEEWGNPEAVNVMRYRQYDASGNPLNKPERLPPPQIPTGIINAMQGAKESVKEALGMYNASIGQKSNAISGVAYDAQKTEADVATYHFGDNRNRAIQQCGRVIVSMLPVIYDTPRIEQIIGEEETPQLIGINGERHEGQKRSYDLTKGKYDVRIVTGASYTTKRQEAAALLGEMLKQDPQAKMIFGDLYFKNLDVAGAEAIAERMRKVIPKELTADEDAKERGEEAPDPEKMQMGQIIQQLQQQMQQMAAELQSKQAEEQAKQAELQIKAAEAETKRQEAEIKRGELKLKIYQATQAPEVLQEQPQAQEDDDVEMLSARIQQKMTQRQQAEYDAQVKAEMEAAEQQRKAELEQQEIMLKQAELEQRQQQSEAMLQTLNSIAQQVNSLTQQVAKPRELIRDANGMVIGAQ